MLTQSANFEHGIKLAINQIENYITNIQPKSIQDIKTATHDLSTAALGAYLSVHSKKELVSFIENLSTSITTDTGPDM
jgi:ABC-type lipopolysaccharide export system ATPase subunit